MPRKASVAPRKKRSSKKVAVASVPEPRMELEDVLVSQLPTEPPPEPESEPETPVMPDPVPMPDSTPDAQTTVTSCVNCAHVPMGVNAVLTMLVALVFTLSVVVVASTFVIDTQSFQIQAYYDTSR